MDKALDWLNAHPTVWEVLFYPLLTALITWLLKPRTPEQYAALPPRIAALLKLVAAVGLDAPKLIESVSQLVRGSSRSVVHERARRSDQGGNALTEAAAVAVSLGAIAVVASRLIGCAHAPVALYSAELEACRTAASSCEAYVDCRHDVQRRHGVEPSGTCVEVQP